MARVFNRAPVPFFGNFTPKPISLCRKTDDEPASITLEIDWFVQPPVFPYGDGAVQVDLTVQGASNPLQKIRSMVIDNTNVDRAVYIKFPDTQDIITVLAQTVLRVAVLTNSLQFQVFTDTPFAVFFDANGPITRILVTNVYLDPLVNRENDTTVGLLLNSFAETSLAPAYSPAGLADKRREFRHSLTFVHSTALDISFGGSGKLLVNSIRMWTYGVYSTTTVKEISASVFLTPAAVFPLIEIIIPVMTDLSAYQRTLVYEKSGVNWFLDENAALTLTNDAACSAGNVIIEFDYTLTPLVPGIPL